VRGQRRFDQMGQRGAAPLPAEEIVRDLRARDERDRNRADSPLKPAADSVLIDSTNLTLDQVVSRAVSIVSQKLRSSGFAS
jgi:cytidylate kinase